MRNLLQWALAGAKERLAALSEEIESIYRTFPSYAVKLSRQDRAIPADP